MFRLLSLLSIAILSGCASSKFKPGPHLTQVQATELMAPTPADTIVAGRAYFIGPFDQLSISVFGVEELSAKEVQVDASGRLSFPLVGSVDVAGKTASQVADMIEQGLRGKYVRNPSVTVNLVRMVSQVVTVEGAVGKPGLYPAIGRMSLVRAIASAEGVTEYSSPDDIVVMRTVDGQKYAALYSLRAIRAGTYPDPEIFANDVIMVGTSRGRQLFRDILAIVPLLTTPIILALQN